jgi:lysophospholipase L1-like esterase
MSQGYRRRTGSGGGTSGSAGGLLEGRTVVAAPARLCNPLGPPNSCQSGRMPLTAYSDLDGIRFGYAGLAEAELVNDNEVFVDAAVEYPAATIYPMTFGGSRFGVLDRYGFLLSDAAPPFVPSGATYWARTRILAPNNNSNFANGQGWTTLAADVTAGATSITLTDLPVVTRTPTRLRITPSSSETVEVVRFSGTGPYTATLRSPLVSSHAAAGSIVGQGAFTNREIYSDQGGLAASNLYTFDILTGTYGAASNSGTAVTGAASNIGDTTLNLTSVVLLRGTVFTLDTAGNAETVTIRTIAGNANPFTAYLAAPLTKAHIIGTTIANTNAGSSIQIPVPTIVTADYAPGAPPSIVLLGDSILFGSNRFLRSWEGYAQMALEGTRPTLQMSKQGESAQQFAANTNGFQRRRLFDAGKWLIYAYGTNDVYGTRTLAQFQTDTITILKWARARNMKIAMCTIMPRTTSGNGLWTLVSDQAVTNSAFNTVRLAVNEWIRSGASGYNDYTIDIADAVEVNSSGVPTRGGGLWMADANPGPYTTDGLHPTYSGHQVLANVIDPARFT